MVRIQSYVGAHPHPCGTRAPLSFGPERFPAARRLPLRWRLLVGQSRFPEVHLRSRSFCLRVSGAVAPSASSMLRTSPARDHVLASATRLTADSGVGRILKGDGVESNSVGWEMKSLLNCRTRYPQV